MLRFVAHRLMQAVLVMLGMSILVFAGVHAVGNPVDVMIGPDATQEMRAELIARCPVVLYTGSLVPREVVAMASPTARVLDSSGMTLDEIMESLR